MDARLVEEAIRKAVQAGAAPAGPNALAPDTDMELARIETDVQIEPQAFEDYLADLRRDPQMARFDSAFVTVPTGFGSSSGLKSVGRLLWALSHTCEHGLRQGPPAPHTSS
jgi:hypothetical protein